MPHHHLQHSHPLLSTSICPSVFLTNSFSVSQLMHFLLTVKNSEHELNKKIHKSHELLYHTKWENASGWSMKVGRGQSVSYIPTNKLLIELLILLRTLILS